jgi:hypothetical protein
MSSPNDVRTAWNTGVWTHATITTITPKIYSFDLPITTGFELGQIRHSQEINFFIYLVSYTEVATAVRQMEQRFRVAVQYYREHNLAGSNYNAAVDALYSLHSRVRAGLGNTWSGTVDYHETPREPRQPTIVSIDARPVWKLETNFDGLKILDL